MLAVSGGEPLLYNGLVELLDAARAAGLATTLTTNGTVLTRSRLAQLRTRLDLLALSLDGVPESHDRIRNCRGAFARLEGNMPAVRESGIRFGFIFTLTQHNLHELDWVAAFALEHGAQLLQVHPLELAGRARAQMVEEHPDALELGFGFAEALRLRAQLQGRLHIHLDVATRPGVRELAQHDGDQAAPTRLADAVSPLVVEADGTVVPLTYGFPRAFALGNLHDAPLQVLGPHWLATTYDRYHATVSRLHSDDVWPARLPVLNLYEAAVAVASEVAPGTPV